MITHRNAWMNRIGTLVHQPHDLCRSLSVDAAHVSCQWMDLCLDGNCRGRDPCLPAQSRAARGFELMATEAVTMLCAAPTVLISLANASEELRRLAPKGIRVVHRRRAARSFDHPTTRRRTRLDNHARLWTDGNSSFHHRLRAAAGTRTTFSQRASHDQGAPGCGVNYFRRDARGRRGR